MSDLVKRLRNLSVCEPGCNGRCVECPADVIREAADRIKRLEAALEPFLRMIEAARDRHMRRSAEAVKLGRIWFDEMPGDWSLDLKMTMAECRAVRAALKGERT